MQSHASFNFAALEQTLEFADRFARRLRGGEVLELIGDVGAGKTSFVKGLGGGLGITEVVQSPTFTISRVYQSPGGLSLYHYDFYRLQEAGIMREELKETLQDAAGVVALEWDATVKDVLPAGRSVQLTLAYTGETGRRLEVGLPAALSYLLDGERG